MLRFRITSWIKGAERAPRRRRKGKRKLKGVTKSIGGRKLVMAFLKA